MVGVPCCGSFFAKQRFGELKFERHKFFVISKNLNTAKYILENIKEVAMSYKEVFKILVGAAAWDAIVAVWFLLSGLYPVTFFGIVFGRIGLGIVFFIDVAIVFVLGYFAWCYGSKKPARVSKSQGRRKNARKAPKRRTTGRSSRRRR